MKIGIHIIGDFFGDNFRKFAYACVFDGGNRLKMTEQLRLALIADAVDVVKGGLLDPAHGCQTVDVDAPFLAQLADAVDVDLGIVHDSSSKLPVYGSLYTMMIPMNRVKITRIRVDNEKVLRYTVFTRKWVSIF